jgi:hypothetical protein
MLSGIIPETSNVASRFKTNFTNEARWFYDENGFHPVEARYNTSIGVGDGNLRPLVSRSWLEDDCSTASGCRNRTVDDDDSTTPCPTRLTIYSTDPRGVVSRDGQRMDVFWQRRNNMTHAWWDPQKDRDWWKEGQDMSTVRSSIWLSLDGGDSECLHDSWNQGTALLDVRQRIIASSLANDVVLLRLAEAPDSSSSLHTIRNSNLYPNSTERHVARRWVLPSPLHLVTLRLSGADPSLEIDKPVVGGEAAITQAWADLQIENFAKRSERVDIAAFLGHISRLVLNAASLHSLTFLFTNDVTRNVSGNGDSLVNGECSLIADNGGRNWWLSIGPRTICSIRIPVSPLNTNDNAENTLSSTR